MHSITHHVKVNLDHSGVCCIEVALILPRITEPQWTYDQIVVTWNKSDC